MKKNTALLFFALTALIISSFITSDTCVFYYPAKKGTVTETTYYDAKGKPTGSKLYIEVADITDSSGYRVEKIHSWTTTKDADTAVSDVNYKVMCKGDKFLIDMSGFIDRQKLEAYRGMDISIDADNIAIPANPVAGQTLNDGQVKVTISNQGMKMMSFTTKLLNRKVEGTESITTPAGTFEAVKISYDTEIHMGLTFKTKGIQWFVKNVGIVRAETYNKKGKKLQSYREMTKITER